MGVPNEPCNINDVFHGIHDGCFGFSVSTVGAGMSDHDDTSIISELHQCFTSGESSLSRFQDAKSFSGYPVRPKVSVSSLIKMGDDDQGPQWLSDAFNQCD